MRHLAAIILIGGLLVPGAAWAGAWVREPGTAYVRFTSEVLATDERYDEDGNIVQWDTSGGGFRNATYEELAFALYAEYGIAAGWAGVGKIVWKHLTAAQPSADFTTWGLSDLQLGIIRGITRGKVVSSISAELVLPTGYDPEEYPALGSGVTDLGLALMAGTSSRAFWTEGKLGYMFRGGRFRDQVGGFAKAGWNASRRLALRGELSGATAVGEDKSSEDSPPQPPGRFDPVKVADPSWLDVAGTVAFQLVRGVGLEFDVRSTVAGRNTLAGTRFTLAVASSPAWRVR